MDRVELPPLHREITPARAGIALLATVSTAGLLYALNQLQAHVPILKGRVADWTPALGAVPGLAILAGAPKVRGEGATEETGLHWQHEVTQSVAKSDHEEIAGIQVPNETLADLNRMEIYVRGRLVGGDAADLISSLRKLLNDEEKITQLLHVSTQAAMAEEILTPVSKKWAECGLLVIDLEKGQKVGSLSISCSGEHFAITIKRCMRLFDPATQKDKGYLVLTVRYDLGKQEGSLSYSAAYQNIPL